MCIDNRRIRLEKYLIPQTGNQIFVFKWWTNDKCRKYVSLSEEQLSAITEFRSLYPDSKGCELIEVSCY